MAHALCICTLRPSPRSDTECLPAPAQALAEIFPEVDKNGLATERDIHELRCEIRAMETRLVVKIAGLVLWGLALLALAKHLTPLG